MGSELPLLSTKMKSFPRPWYFQKGRLPAAAALPVVARAAHVEKEGEGARGEIA
jgi:hypothetical protein